MFKQIFSDFVNAPIFVLLFYTLQLMCHLGVILGVCTFIVTTGRLHIFKVRTVQCTLFPVCTVQVMLLSLQALYYAVSRLHCAAVNITGYASRALCSVLYVQSALCCSECHWVCKAQTEVHMLFRNANQGSFLVTCCRGVPSHQHTNSPPHKKY